MLGITDLIGNYFRVSLSNKLTSFFSGTSDSSWFGIVKEKVEKINILYVARVLTFFTEKLVTLLHYLTFEFWRTQNNIHPSITVDHNIHNHSAAVESGSEREYILPCIQRLQRLEKVFEELSNKPDGMPQEKEKMLMDSMNRIKSVEFDLEQTKRVLVYISQSYRSLDYADLIGWWLNFMLLMQVLHATVMKQLEIAELLENLKKTKCRVS